MMPPLIRDLVDSIDDGWDLVGTLLLLAVAVLLAWWALAHTWSGVRRVVQRCGICRAGSARLRSARHGRICDPCAHMLAHRSLGIPARDT